MARDDARPTEGRGPLITVGEFQDAFGNAHDDDGDDDDDDETPRCTSLSDPWPFLQAQGRADLAVSTAGPALSEWPVLALSARRAGAWELRV